MSEKGFASLETLDLPESDSLERDRYKFVGVREHMRSVVTIALQESDRLEVPAAASQFDEFCQFVAAIHRYAGSVGSTKMGSFGILLHTFNGDVAEELRQSLVAQKRGKIWRKEMCVSWVADLESRRVFRHRGLPIGMFPGSKWIAGVIQRGAAV